MNKLKIGDKCIAFDANEWFKSGDIGDNSCFFKEAIILNIRKTKYNEDIADILFEENKQSNGHFLNTLKK